MPRTSRDEDVDRVVTLTLQKTPEECDTLEHPGDGAADPHESEHVSRLSVPLGALGDVLPSRTRLVL